MKKSIFIRAVLFSLFTSTALVACSSDDDEEGGAGASSGLIITDTPKAEGWKGDLQNGDATYVPYIVDNSYAEDEYDMDLQPYYAFNFSNGVCKEAVFGLICPNEKIAKQYETIFKNGTWADLDDDDDYDDYDDYRVNKVQSRIKNMTRAVSDYDFKDLALLVYRNGKVLYVTIDCLKGKSGNTLQKIVIFWNTGEGEPDIAMGKWDDNAGRYTNNNLYGLGIDYEINTTFDNNLLTKYTTTMTFPNKTWAELLFEDLEESNREIGDLLGLGLYPEATLNGKSVNENAVIVGDITKEQTLQVIAFLDWSMARPFITMFAD